MSTPKFKKFNIEAYKPGKSKIRKLKKVIKLSANESALGMSPRAKKLISSNKFTLDKYPDGKSENLKEAIAKDKGTYGKLQVENAIENGAAESMLILSEKTRSKNGRKLLALAEQNRTNIIEISSHHHGGEMLNGLGDVAVILRYRLT